VFYLFTTESNRKLYINLLKIHVVNVHDKTVTISTSGGQDDCYYVVSVDQWENALSMLELEKHVLDI
jgi:hypothetical protein